MWRQVEPERGCCTAPARVVSAAPAVGRPVGLVESGAEVLLLASDMPAFPLALAAEASLLASEVPQDCIHWRVAARLFAKACQMACVWLPTADRSGHAPWLGSGSQHCRAHALEQPAGCACWH